jgi:HSP20 family protein
MQVYRISTPQSQRSRCNIKSTSTTHNNNMAAFFPRVFGSEFAPVFRLLDDYSTTLASRSNICAPVFTQPQRSFRQTFQPRFDVRESKEAYTLQGELPGVEQKDINIEFTDASTLSIRGSTETVREEDSRPSAAIEAAQPEKAVEATESESSAGSSTNYHKASVEEEEGVLVDADGETDSTSTVANTPATEAAQTVAQPAETKPTYWISERSVGSFARSFQFPQRVEHEAVKASLKDGILSIVVPKAAKVSRRINVE